MRFEYMESSDEGDAILSILKERGFAHLLCHSNNMFNIFFFVVKVSLKISSKSPSETLYLVISCDGLFFQHAIDNRTLFKKLDTLDEMEELGIFISSSDFPKNDDFSL